ncbi:MAG TPA: glutaminyl-peptide cyclotransferase, partial [Roseiflexaceae bacterium]|nr:glutaminyl-peptide cyclotransferase [Roseiflexaceae bacterium]
ACGNAPVSNAPAPAATLAPAAPTTPPTALPEPALPAPTETATAEPTNRVLAPIVSGPTQPSMTTEPTIPPTVAATASATVEPTAMPTPIAESYQVINTYPHDPQAFTQGLVYEDGVLYEGTGLNGQSTLRKVELETGAVLQQHDLASEYFGEGITIVGDKIFQLTWRSNIGFIYDKATFEQIGQFSYSTEGWGLTHDDTRLIMSDGTATLHFLDPQTQQETGSVQVTDQGNPVTQLNELEYINGEVYANIWQTDWIARIDLQTGTVAGWISLAGLLSPEERKPPTDVLNGIAYDAAGDRLFVTGKRWPKLFEIKLLPAQ